MKQLINKYMKELENLTDEEVLILKNNEEALKFTQEFDAVLFDFKDEFFIIKGFFLNDETGGYNFSDMESFRK